ncbi:hypothetical protein [Kitasatospora cineracea]|uniref:Lipoprotein n=1 Tax=Kitasatospora cineracea TaxID=88074 RepID=A0A8G1UKI8_9ACTN|nr:hypothetical protein [Kitasatospora cineracea]ROR45646.1 hypothetical protein EDD39_3888 [Kitasatospora cineracea]
MTGRQPLAARALLAASALAAVLALAACDPEGTDGGDAASPALSPAASAPKSSPAAAKSSPAAPPSTGAAPSSSRPVYPGGKHTLTEARTAGGLARATGDAQLSDVPVDPGEMREGMTLVEANYLPKAGGSGRSVLFAGVDNVPEDPSRRREHLWRGLIDYAHGEGSTGDPGGSAQYPAGPLGGNLECFPLGSDTLCGWVDNSTAGVALFPGTAPADAAEQFVLMRADLEH